MRREVCAGPLAWFSSIPLCTADLVTSPAMIRHAINSYGMWALIGALLLALPSNGISLETNEFTAANRAGGRWYGHLSEVHHDVIAWKGIEYVK